MRRGVGDAVWYVLVVISEGCIRHPIVAIRSGGAVCSIFSRCEVEVMTLLRCEVSPRV